MNPKAVAVIDIVLGIIAQLAKLAGVTYEEAMAELAKRTAVDTEGLDAAAAEQDAPLGE